MDGRLVWWLRREDLFQLICSYRIGLGEDVRNCAVPLHNLGRILGALSRRNRESQQEFYQAFNRNCQKHFLTTCPNPTKPIVHATCLLFFLFLTLTFNATHLRGGHARQRQPNTCPSIPIAIPPSVRLANVPCTPSDDNHCSDLVWILVLEVRLGAMKRAREVTLVTLRLAGEARHGHVW